MSRAYLRLDPGFAERKAHYSDGAFRALVEVLCLADEQLITRYQAILADADEPGWKREAAREQLALMGVR